MSRFSETPNTVFHPFPEKFILLAGVVDSHFESSAEKISVFFYILGTAIVS